MVFYFTCSDPRYVIYMGRDKYENEHLIQYGWPEDLWFHVDKLSSAHVYLRLPPGDGIEDVPMDIVMECAQLTKANSIAGCKLNNVPIVYTMWSNLRKQGDMATGQVGFHNRAEVLRVTIEKKINEVINRLNKTKEEKHNDPNELSVLRAKRDAEEMELRKANDKEHWKQMALSREEERMAGERAEAKERDAYGVDSVDADELEAARAAAEAAIMRDMQKRSQTSKIDKLDKRRGVNDADLCSELFGGGVIGGQMGSDSDDDDPWGVDDGWQVAGDSDDDQTPSKPSVYGTQSGSGKNYGLAGLGGLGIEAAAVEAARRTEKQMEALAAKAQKQREVAAQRAKEEKEEKQKRAEEEKAAAEVKSQQSHQLTLLRAEVEALEAAARCEWEEASGSAEGGEVREGNAEVQEEELMVVESIFADDYALKEGTGESGTPATLTLIVRGQTKAAGEAQVQLRVTMVDHYPSHLPPRCEVLEGAPVMADEDFIVLSLVRLFHERRGEREEGEPPMGILHEWTEWVRDEWIGEQ